jgi:succinate dehydrogenase flavin-adding protein (antitoxin of CptAB toxin-antitoxin module)
MQDDVRRLRYRLKRQGMLELDVWLSKLEVALQTHDVEVTKAVSLLLSYEIPDLQACMHGDKAIPYCLNTWLRS